MRSPVVLVALAPAWLVGEGANAAEQIDLTTLSPLYVSGLNMYVHEILPGFTQTSSPNLLSITGEANLTSSLSTHNTLYLPVTGDFTATVTSTVTANAGGGVFADFNAGYAGIGYNSYGAYVNYGFGLGNVDPLNLPASVSDITIQLSRLGANLTLAASIGTGAFQTLYTLTGASVLGPTGFDLTGYGTPGIPTTSTTTYTNFEIETYAPSSVSGISGGTSSSPVPLPSSTVGSVSGDIGGPGGPTSDYFSFYWEGGNFAASVGVPNADVLEPPASYQFDLFAGRSCSADPACDTVSADPSNDYENELSRDLGPGYYTVGIILEGTDPSDPMYSVDFETPVIGGSVSPAVPEPSTWAMLLLGFASLGFAGYRRAKSDRAMLAA
jgi:PEP-CTERM motif-containing protein